MSQLKRLYWIDQQIRSGKYPNPQSIMEEWGVSSRTAYADRDYLLTKCSAPLKTDRRRGGWYYTDPTYVLPALNWLDKEAATLRRSLLAAKEYLNLTDAEILKEVSEKLNLYLPAPFFEEHQQVRGSVHLVHPLVRDLVTDCQRAVEERYRLKILYYSVRRDETRERVVQPYSFLYWRGEPHLIAHCEWRKGIRQFFLGRIREWQLLGEHGAFARDPEFDLDAYLQRGLDLQHGADLVTVRARFSEYQARWIRERVYHESQEMEDLPDGGLILTLRVAGTEEIRRWLMGYGAEVEVLEPASLREEMAEEVKKLEKIYGGDAE